MQLGMIGLGRMGGNIVRRLMKHGHTAVVYDKDEKAVAALAADGAAGSKALEDFVAKLEKPRTAWVMLPAGKITEATIEALAKLMQGGDVIIDGGNTFWQDDVRRGKVLKERGIHYVDVGTSGGVWGIERGYCMSTGSIRSSQRSRLVSATSRARLAARGATTGSNKATSTPARSAPGISSR
jgi:6-phosphogluconate dehydrogenase